MFNYSVAKLVSFSTTSKEFGSKLKTLQIFYNNLIIRYLHLPPPSAFWSKITSERFHIFP